MKFDMHCHTAEGSLDASVTIRETITTLKEKGYNGMLVTDHNSYNGYKQKPINDNFTILRGVEYDTSDAGHMLIILPTSKEYEVFTAKGMSLEDTINVVHALGGVIGAAHPFDYYKFGMFNNPKWISQLGLIKKLDFIETFNACGKNNSNHLARTLAKELNIAQVGGSDSHRLDTVGMGSTTFRDKIRSEDDLITAIKISNFNTNVIDGVVDDTALINKHKILHGAGIRAYYLWNVMVIKNNRRNKIKKLKEIIGLT